MCYLIDHSIEIYQLVLSTKKQVLLDLASSSVTLTDFQSRVLQQLKAMEQKCRTQQKQQQTFIHPKSDSTDEEDKKGSRHSAPTQLQESLDLEKAKVASLEYLVEELQAKTKEQDALLAERDTSISELLRQINEPTNPPLALTPPEPLPILPSPSAIDNEQQDDRPSQLKPSPPPQLLPCAAPDATVHSAPPIQAHDEVHQQALAVLEFELASAKANIQLVLSKKDEEIASLRQHIIQLQTTTKQNFDKMQRQDQLLATKQASIESMETLVKDLRTQNEELKLTAQENDNLTHQNAQLEYELKELESFAGNLQMLNQHLRTQEQALNTQNQTHKSQYQKLQSQHSELKKICFDQDNTIADLSATLGPLQAQVTALRSQLQQLEQQVQQKAQQPLPEKPVEHKELHSQFTQTIPQTEVPPPAHSPPSPSLLPPPPPSLPSPPPPQPQEPLPKFDVNPSKDTLQQLQQQSDKAAKKCEVDPNDLEEVQRLVQELEKIFLLTFTELNRLRAILEQEGVSPTPLPPS